MSIASAITAAQGKVADCYTAISNKGGTIPATQNLSNMPTAISSITTSGTISSLSITPSTSAQTITATGGVDGYSPISVSAVDSSIDANITAGNIKSGVSILGVSGSVTPLNGTTLSVTPSTSAQSISPSSPYNGFTSVSVSAVTSSIDNNITAGNIKDGVSILGVTGTYTGGGGGSSKYGCTIDNLLGDVDANGVLQLPADTSGDIVFTGVKDVVNYGLYYKYYYNTNLTHNVSFPDLETVSGNHFANNAFSFTNVQSASFPKLKTVSGQNALQSMFQNSHITTISLPELETVSGSNGMKQFVQGCLYITSLSLPKLKIVSGGYGLAYLYQSSAIVTLSFPELITVSSNSGCQGMCNGCSFLETASFPKLSDISGQSTFSNAYSSCARITDIYFNALTTSSFGNSYKNQFNNMFNSGSSGTAATSGNVTIHFPSNLSSTISGLTGYPNFGATAGRVTLSFDLTATS